LPLLWNGNFKILLFQLYLFLTKCLKTISNIFLFQHLPGRTRENKKFLMCYCWLWFICSLLHNLNSTRNSFNFFNYISDESANIWPFHSSLLLAMIFSFFLSFFPLSPAHVLSATNRCNSQFSLLRGSHVIRCNDRPGLLWCTEQN
jgi:hypothetical protein